jgi:hypothetical protein
MRKARKRPPASKAAEDFFVKGEVRHGVSSFAAEVTQEKFQRFHMSARFFVVVHWIEAEFFRRARVN